MANYSNITKVQRFFYNLHASKVAFIGAGVSHAELIRLFLQKGIDVTVLDKKDKEHFDSELYDDLASRGAKFILGDNYLDSLDDFDVVYRTPGMYYNNPKLVKARDNGVIVTSEMESFFELCPCKIYAVTGSDGKTTTTTLIANMLKTEGYTVWARRKYRKSAAAENREHIRIGCCSGRAFEFSADVYARISRRRCHNKHSA